MLCINGKKYDVAGMSVADWLHQEGFLPERVAVEINGEIVHRDAYDKTVFCDGDTVEIVRFVGGG